LASVLAGERALLVTANRSQDIASALRLAREFGFELWLDSAPEAYLLLEEIGEAGVPVIVHPTMARPAGEFRNASYTTAGRLADAGITVAMQSGYESYVPKVRVVLFEAAIAAAWGLGAERALESVTITPARILGIEDRVGSIEVGKDGDLALYSGDPFEYTTRCVGTIIEGEVVSEGERPNEAELGVEPGSVGG
jgi:imidazolonepropionase-like amidohydrolase